MGLLPLPFYFYNMACFDDFITYQGSGITPTSGIYVNNLYGIQLVKANAIANTDYATGIAFINEKIAFAITLVSNELKHYAMPYFKEHSVIGHYFGGEFDDDFEYHAVLTTDRGLRITIRETTLAKIIVNRVRILANNSGDYNVVITDGEETTNYPITLVARTEQDLEINYEANRNRIYITIDNTSLNPAEGSSGMSCQGLYDVLDVDGWNGSGVTSHYYGIKANITIICSDDNLACLLKHKLGLSVLYRFGIEFVREVQESDRLNYFTLLNRTSAQELEEKYWEDYNKSMEDLARSMPILLRQLDDCCITCNQARYIERVP